MTVTVTFEPVTKRIPDARRTRVPSPRVSSSGSPARKALASPLRSLTTTIPRSGISPFTVSRPETVISPLPVACTRAEGARWSARCASARLRRGEGGDDEHERDGGHESPTHHSTSNEGAAPARGPALVAGMLHRPDVGAGGRRRKRFASLCSGNVRPAPAACAIRRPAAGRQGSSLTFSCTETGASSLTPSSHRSARASPARPRARRRAPRPRARGAGRPRGRPRRSRRTAGRSAGPRGCGSGTGRRRSRTCPATFWPAWKHGQARAALGLLGALARAQVRAPGAPAGAAGPPPGPPWRRCGGSAFAHRRPLASAPSRRASRRRPARRIVGRRTSLPRRPPATEARRAPHTVRERAPVRVALAQLNTVVGDIDGNADRVAAALADAGEAGADVTLVPELAISGYPPEDLLLRPAFAAACREALDRRRGRGAPRPGGDRASPSGTATATTPRRSWPTGGSRRSTASASCRTTASSTRRATSAPATAPMVLEALGARIGIAVCEDIWYPSPVAADLAAGARGPGLLHLRLAVPPRQGRPARGDARDARRRLRGRARLLQPGGRPGRAGLRRPLGALRRGRASWWPARPSSSEHLLVADVDLGLSARRRLREPLARRLPAPADRRRSRGSRRPRPRATAAARGRAAPSPPALRDEPEVWAALRTGLRDYVDKNRFPGVLVGLSGGIDSALTAALAADALGPERVTGVAMPSSHSSPESLAGAQALAESLAIRLLELPIAAGGGGLRRGPGRGVRRAVSPTSPRRTSRRGRAARS